MRIGWLADRPERYVGGAELESAALIQAAPAWAEVVACPPEDVAADVDGYVIHNCVSYDRAILPLLEGKPVVKRVHDLWPHGDADVRGWLLRNASCVLLSGPLQHREMVWRIDSPVAYIPSPVDVRKFRRAALVAQTRSGNVWLGRLFDGKGVDRAREWAEGQGVEIDVYGFGPLADALAPPLKYCGKVGYRAAPGLLARYARFVFLPDAVEPFGRTVVEAWAAGCELVVNRNVGALWWLEHDPDAIAGAVARFWKIVREAVD